MGVLNTLMDKLYKKEELEKEIHDLDNDIRMLEKKLTPEEVENMSYEKLKCLWHEIEYGVTRPKRAKFEEIIERKREEKYPELKRAVYFPDINQLDIPDEDKKRIDRALADNCRYIINEKRIMRGDIAGIKVKELEMLHEIGVLKKSVRFCIDGEYCCRYSEDELNKYFRYWELDEKFSKSDLSIDELKEWEDLDESGYNSIWIEDEDGNCTELLSKEDYDSYGEKEVIYKVNSEKMDASWDKV